MIADAVLFDLDGTLADTAADLGAALNRVLNEEGRAAMPLTALRPHTSNGTRGLLGVGFGIVPSDAVYQDLAQRFLNHYANGVCVHTELFPGIADLLAELDASGVRWGVVTNKPHRFTVPLLEGLGLRERCACIVSGDSAAHPKPDPAPLWLGCKIAGVRAERSLYVGDDERDVIAGRAAGMVTVAATWGYLGVAAPPEHWGAAALIVRPEQVLDLIELTCHAGTAANRDQ